MILTDLLDYGLPDKSNREVNSIVYADQCQSSLYGPAHPYLGIGAGLGHTEVNTVNARVGDREFTFAMQLLLGFELRFENLSHLAELKHVVHDMESGGNEYNPTATGLFVGMGFNW